LNLLYYLIFLPSYLAVYLPFQNCHAVIQLEFLLAKIVNLLLHLAELVQVLNSELAQDLIRLLLNFLPEMDFSILTLLNFNLEKLFQCLNLIQHLGVTFSLSIPLFISFCLYLILDLAIVIF